VFVSEEELSVQVRKIDGIEIDNVDFAEASENKILEKFATNSTGADHEHASLRKPSQLWRQTNTIPNHRIVAWYKLEFLMRRHYAYYRVQD